VILRVREIRLEGDGPLELRDGVLGPSLQTEDESETIVRACQRRVVLDRRLVLDGRARKIALLFEERAAQVMPARRRGVLCEDAIDRRARRVELAGRDQPFGPREDRRLAARRILRARRTHTRHCRRQHQNDCRAECSAGAPRRHAGILAPSTSPPHPAALMPRI
jgi:hypothetical protein